MARYQFTPEDRRRGGCARAAQPSFIEHQRARGRKGAAALLARPGGYACLMDKIAAYHRAHPSSAEQFVHDTLLALGYQEGRDFVREKRLTLAGREFLLDFVIGDIVLEPGHRRWHGSPADTLDGQDHAARDAERDRLLTVIGGLTVIRLDAEQIARHPEQVRAQIVAILSEPEAQAA
jgi:hypothetical protein